MSRDRAIPVLRLVLSCVVLGLGVAAVLLAGFGNDGYSSLVNGVVRASGLPYGLVHITFGLTLVVLAAARGVRPGPGTVVHPLVVGITVQTVLDHVPAAEPLVIRIGLLGVGLVVVAAGVAGYLTADLGAGPVEAAGLALHPMPFRSGYSALRAAGALTGWLLGADIGLGTLVIVLGVGPGGIGAGTLTSPLPRAETRRCPALRRGLGTGRSNRA